MMKCKNYFTLLLLLITCLSLSNCGKSLKEDILGTWTYTDRVLTFEKNGTGTKTAQFMGRELFISFEYEIKNDTKPAKLITNITYPDKKNVNYDIEIDGDKLIITYESGAMETYIRKK